MSMDEYDRGRSDLKDKILATLKNPPEELREQLYMHEHLDDHPGRIVGTIIAWIEKLR